MEITQPFGLPEDTYICWATSNSSYYLEQHYLKLVHPGDDIIVIGHRTHNDMKTHEIPQIKYATQQGLEMNNYYIEMAVVNTPDYYFHPSSELLKYDVKAGIGISRQIYTCPTKARAALSWSYKPWKVRTADNYDNVEYDVYEYYNGVQVHRVDGLR